MMICQRYEKARKEVVEEKRMRRISDMNIIVRYLTGADEKSAAKLQE